MNQSLQDKNFVIAGGSRGIGLAITKQLLSQGANVSVFSRSTGDLPEHEMLKHQACDFLTDDFSNTEFANANLPASIHGVAYCPGSINLRSFRSLKLDDFQQDLEVNLLGAVRFLQGCLAGLKKGGADGAPSSIVVFSTVAVSTGLSLHASVSAAKGALEGLTRSLAAELAPIIRVNCVAPALTDTPLAAKFLASDEKRKAMSDKYPLRRVGSPDDVASVATMLLAPESSWVTGQIIGVDGGMAAIGS